jgi:tetratricopeptide (TPR) repeat protein
MTCFFNGICKFGQIYSTMFQRHFFLLLLAVVPFAGNAQNMDKTLAEEYVRQGAYEKAVVLYEKLYDKDPSNSGYYSALLQSYIILKQHSDAVKLTQKQSKRFNKIPKYIIDFGYALELNKDTAKAIKEFERVIKDLGEDELQVRQVAESFYNYAKLTWVVKTYERGTKLLKNNRVFLFDLAKAYTALTDYKNSVNAYLTLIELDPSRVQEIKNVFQPLLENKPLTKELGSQLYSKLQKNPDADTWNELAVWYAVQQRDFEDALIQTKAIDKKKGENGRRVMDIARLARYEKQYDDAINGFEYVAAKGKSNPLYFSAQHELLSTRKEKIQESPLWTKQDAINLKYDYQRFFADHGKNPNTANAIIEYAEILAKYVFDLDSAIAELESLINMSLLPSTKNRAKLILGDFYVMMDEVWEAMLLYGQVDKEEKDSPLGEEARFKHARLFYFKGEFELSKELLNVLKSATSELIANDALNLSVFIIDNLGTDSVSEPMEQFAAAELLFLQNKEEAAIEKLDSLFNNYKGHSLTDDIYFIKARIFIKKKEYPKAVEQLDLLLTNFKYGILGDDATFLLAEVYEVMIKEPEKASKFYKELLLNYKDSVFVVEARKRFRKLRGDKPDEDI